VSFNFAGLLDSSAFPRFAKAKGLNMAHFHMMNLVLHVAPCCMTILLPPSVNVSFGHGVIAAAIHMGWGLAVSKGTLLLDDLYLPMQSSFWYTMWASAALSEAVIAPMAIFPVVSYYWAT
jgi:hypothetical protein